MLNSPFAKWNVRFGVALVYVLTALLALSLVSAQLRSIERHTDELALQRGEGLFRLIELTRLWNARHGGVYVPEGPHAQANPYLEHPKRDIRSDDGRALTMINPAYMTRQIAELAEQALGERLHITSLKPLRPANSPDPWERQALEIFDRREKTHLLELIDTPEGPLYRYMAPLEVKQPCLACHEKQGYELGDIRGGISVTMDARPLLAVRDAQRWQVIWGFGGAALLVAFLLHLVIASQFRYVRRLHRVNESQECLIAERTEHLRRLNEALNEEVVQRKSLEEKLRHLAYFDALTGLPNRSMFDDRLHQAIGHAERYQCLFALAYVDLDYFKEVNDTHGHTIGDKVLIEVARRLLGEVRESDTVARLGGDEFAIILHHVDDCSEVDSVAQRINAQLAEPFIFGEVEAHLSASIGVALYPQHGDTAEKLVDVADAAMYVVKEAGRNAYRIA